MPEQRLAPGKFKIIKMVIESVQNIDIRNHYEEINIYEDLFSSTYYGEIVVTDAVNLVSGTNSLPILGHEILKLVIKVPNVDLSGNMSDDDDILGNLDYRFINLRARITNIERRTLLNEGTQQYLINFVQEEFIMDQKTRVSKSYNGTYKTMINSILTDLSPNNDRKLLSDTKYTYNFISPNWHPFKAINWLTQRSLSPKYSGSSFFFYTTIYNKDVNTSYNEDENTESNYFFLKPLESMIESDLTRKIYFVPSNINKANEKTIIMDYSNASTYDIVNSFDILDNLSGGFYGNKLITHDIVNKKYNITAFNYEDSFQNYKHLHKGKQLGIKRDYFNLRLSDYPDANIKFYSKDKALSENYIEKVTHSKLSQLMSIHNFRIKFALPGDGRISVGDKVKFSFPSPEPVSDNSKMKDVFYHGKYIVTSIRHIFHTEKYEVAIECAKESYKINVTDFQPKGNRS